MSESSFGREGSFLNVALVCVCEGTLMSLLRDLNAAGVEFIVFI